MGKTLLISVSQQAWGAYTKMSRNICQLKSFYLLEIISENKGFVRISQTTLSIARQACWTTVRTVKKERKRNKLSSTAVPCMSHNWSGRPRTSGINQLVLYRMLCSMSTCSTGIPACFTVVLRSSNLAAHCWCIKEETAGARLRTEDFRYTGVSYKKSIIVDGEHFYGTRKPFPEGRLIIHV